MRTAGWDVVHSYNSTLDGWLVLVARRHIGSLAELHPEEAAELGPLIQRVSSALHQVIGCEKTYLMQFAEDPDHPHVHIHVVPRRADHPDGALGADVFELLSDDPTLRVPEDRMNRLAEKIRGAL